MQIRKCGLTLTLKKSQFAQPYVKFCGRIVGSGTHRVDPARRESILLLKEPETKKQLRSVLGLFSWFREYIPHYTELCMPLIELTGKRVPDRIPWSQIHKDTFEKMKKALSDATDVL